MLGGAGNSLAGSPVLPEVRRVQSSHPEGALHSFWVMLASGISGTDAVGNTVGGVGHCQIVVPTSALQLLPREAGPDYFWLLPGMAFAVHGGEESKQTLYMICLSIVFYLITVRACMILQRGKRCTTEKTSAQV